MATSPSIGIIGMGWVGSSVAISTLQSGIATELVLYDVREAIAEGEAMDLSHGSSFYPGATVRSAHPREMLGCSAIVIAAGRGGRPSESRLDLLKENAVIIRELAEYLKGFQGFVIVVTNPVDVLTYEFFRASGLPVERVIGTGTMLDTARLRQVLGIELNMSPKSIHAQVVGEHGDSEVVLWTSAMIGGTPLRSWPGWEQAREAEVAHEVKVAAQEIIKRKGATNHAIGLVTAQLLKWMLRGERRVLTVSRVQDGACGIRDVAISLPTVVGAKGAEIVVAPEFSPGEREAFDRSAEVLRQAIASIDT